MKQSDPSKSLISIKFEIKLYDGFSVDLNLENHTRGFSKIKFKLIEYPEMSIGYGLFVQSQGQYQLITFLFKIFLKLQFPHLLYSLKIPSSSFEDI